MLCLCFLLFLNFILFFFFFSSRRRHTRLVSDWSSDVCSSDLADALNALPDRERQVLMLRYGLHDQEPKTLEEIGRRLGLTRERVRQIELESLRRLATLREMQYVAG